MKIIAITNQKGGVAKTTTTINLGAALAEKGKRVLLIDMDPQASLTIGLGLPYKEISETIASVLEVNNRSITTAIYETGVKNLHIAPSETRLKEVEDAMLQRFNREAILKTVLGDNTISQDYDYVLLDTHPSLGLLTVNALVAAEWVIIPVETKTLALQGVATLLAHIETVQQQLNSQLSVMGILATRHRKNTILGKSTLSDLPKFKKPIFNTVITESVSLSEAPAMGQTVLEYAKNSSSANQYRELAQEVIERG